MPHLWNELYVVTPQELEPWYNSIETLRSEIYRYKDKDYGIKKVCKGGNGRQMLIAFDSLPNEIQHALGDPRKVEHILERFYRTDTDAVEYYHQKVQFLSQKLVEEYITNASVLVACQKLKEARERERRSKRGSMRGVMQSVCADARVFNDVLQRKHQVRHTLPASEKRFKMAFKAFLTPAENYPYDYGSLISGKVRNQNSRKVDEPVMELLNALFAGQDKKPNRTEVSRVYDGFLQGYVEVINQETGELYDPKEYRPLSDATIIKYLGSWKERIGTEIIRNHDRGYQLGQFITPFKFRQPEFAGSIISVDDRQPPFQYAKSERVWFYNAIDLASEAFTVWVYGKSKAGLIMEFYRQLVRNYSDWGYCLPWEIEAEASLNSSFTNTFLRDGHLFQKVNIYANSARSKRIERYFRDLRYVYEKDREGWLARPHSLSESNRPRNDKQSDVLVPYGTIVQNSLKDIEDWNNSPHSKHPNKSRWDVFTEMQHPQLKPTNWRAILPSLGYVTKTSVRVGEIALNGEKFLLGDGGEIYAGDRLIELMSMVQDQEIKVCWLDGNDGKVLKALVYLNDMCVCEAIAKPSLSRAALERTEDDMRAEEILAKYRATITAYMSRKRASIDKVLVVDNRPKTLGRSFVMPGINRYEVTDSNEAPEVLPEPEEMDMVPVINEQQRNSFVRSTKDRM